MPEVPHAGENHRDIESVRGVNHFGVPDTAAGLNDSPDARLGDRFEAIRKGNQSIRGHDCAACAVTGFNDS